MNVSKNNVPKGWWAAGSHPQEYWMGVDLTLPEPAVVCATLKCIVPEASGFGTLMQSILVEE